MSVPYYTHNVSEYPEGSLARGTPVDVDFAAIAAAFALLPAADGTGGFSGVNVPVGAAVNPSDALQLQQFLTWAQSVNANNHSLTNLSDPSSQSSKDAANAAWVISQINAFLIAGGTPGNVAITGLNKGSATANQFIRINGAGTAVIGSTPVIADISKGGAAAFDQVRVNAGGTAFETFTPPTVDTDLNDAMAAIYAYNTL